MQSLLCFIQVLLMLTHSRIVPDLGWVWQTEPGHHTELISFQQPVTERRAVTWYAAATVQKDDRNKAKQTQPARIRLPEIFIRLQAATSSKQKEKRWLVFCQLKADG